MDRRSRVVVGVFVVVVVGMTVGQISMGMFMIVVDHRCRSLAVKASATLAHVGLLAPGTRQFDDNEMPYGNPFRPEGKGSEIAQNLHKTHILVQHPTRISPGPSWAPTPILLKSNNSIFWHAECFKDIRKHTTTSTV